jgi:nucleotide sugar dehydrogenase
VKVGVIGVGHVGLVTVACLAEFGHDVVGMDDDVRKIATLEQQEMPFFEPGLSELLLAGQDAGRIRFTTSAADAIADADVVFICVGTPRREDGSPNLSYVQAAASSVAKHATGPVVVAEKSTVPVRTGERIAQALRLEAQARGQDLGHQVVSNPEFLKEGTAVEDTLRPDRIVVGADSPHAHEVMRRLYEPQLARHDCPYVATDVRTAELIKHASNAFLATKISFINAVARICELAGADVYSVADAMGHDARIGRAFLNAGLGYGGSCLVGEETVLASHQGRVQHLTMVELWAHVTATGLDEWRVLAWKPDQGEPSFLPLAAVSARPYQGTVVEVRTKMGRRVRSTADHPWLVAGSDLSSPQMVLAEDLTTEHWVPLVSSPPATQTTPGSSDLLAAVAAGAISSDQVIQRLSDAQLTAVRDRSTVLPTPRRYDVLRNGTIRLAEYKSLDIDLPGGLYGTARNGTYTPDSIPIDEEARLPDFIWTAPDSLKRALLRGLWDGDGSWSLINGGPSVILEYGTVSQRLADGMLRLLGDLGLIASVRTGRTKKSTVDTYWIRISGAEQVERALWLFPDEEAAQIATAIQGQSKRIAPTGSRRTADGTAWVRVTDLISQDFDGWVYSVEVPEAHTIVTTGGLVTHNCFPKDVEAFIHIAGELGYDFGMLRETERINREAKGWPIRQLRQLLWNLTSKDVAVLGVAFKPGTDDVRDAPALEVIDALLAEGANVRLHDPVAMDHVRERYPDVTFCDKAEDALRGAHAVVVCTEWDEYRAITPERLAELLEYPVVVDARAVWDPQALAAVGLSVASVGRALESGHN